MISSLIFSRDRAMQLHACIKAIRKNFTQLKQIHILYKYTNDFFKEGYYKLINESKNDNIVWHQENNFENQTKEIINNFNDSYTVCFVDDDVMINNITDQELNEITLLFGDGISCISLKHNKHITFCGSANVAIKLPLFVRNDNILMWNWSKENHLYDWGYPSSINSTIYKTNEFKQIVNAIQFYNPNSLEGEINNKRNNNKPYMISFSESKSFNVCNNYVKSDNYANPYSGYSVQELNKKYLDGFIIDIDEINIARADRLHGFYLYKFRRI